MPEHPLAALHDAFADLTDPRVNRTKDHLLMDVVGIAICAVLCGADSWVAIEAFGVAKQAWLQQFLALPNGIPSHDTFGRVFAALDASQFQQGFLRWIRAIWPSNASEVVAIDGKTLRGSHDRGVGKEAIHLVSAWASQRRLVLAQRTVDTKSNEITAIPEVLRLLDLEGCTVTIDAMGCQTAIAKQVVQQGANYVLAVKENQEQLYADVADTFRYVEADGWQGVAHQQHREVTKAHGRIEQRDAWLIQEAEYLAYLNPKGRWTGLSAIGLVATERRDGRTVTQERRYYIVGGKVDAATFAHATRRHWGIENQVHWVLDVTFGEDASRVRTGHAPENFAVLRHIALNLLRHAPGKGSINTKRFRAALDDQYLLQVLRSQDAIALDDSATHPAIDIASAILPRECCLGDCRMEYALDRFERETQAAVEATGLVAPEQIELGEPKVNVPADLVLPCFRAAKAQGRNPADLAAALAAALRPGNDSLLGEANAIGPFLNFRLDPGRTVDTVLGEIARLRDDYGGDDIGAGQRVIVEYSSPNIARRMNIGHLRTTVIGHAIDNILDFLGYEVISDNHLGDWGTQFGGLIYAYRTWGFKPELEHDPIEAMIELYARFNAAAEQQPELKDAARQWFKRLEDGDPEARDLWRWMVELTMEEFAETYSRLGIEFDHAYGESFYEPMLAGVIEEAIAKGVAKVEEGGAVSVGFDDKLPSYLIRTTDGRTLYQTRDIAGALYRWQEWAPARNIYVVGQEQTLHFQQVFETLRRMGHDEIANRSIHISFGQLNDADGRRFSMRRGRVVFLEDVLDEGVERAREIVDTKNPDLPEEERAAIAEAVGVGAVIYNDLYQDPRRNITFDWDRMLAFTGNSAPYIQMMHARCCSILREAGVRQLPSEAGGNLPLFEGLPEADVGVLQAEQEVALVKQLARFPQHVRRAGTNFAPYVVAEWLYGSARAFSRFYDDLSVLNAESPELRNARLYLVTATAQGLRNGLRLLGIKSPERM